MFVTFLCVCVCVCLSVCRNMHFLCVFSFSSLSSASAIVEIDELPGACCPPAAEPPRKQICRRRLQAVMSQSTSVLHLQVKTGAGKHRKQQRKLTDKKSNLPTRAGVWRVSRSSLFEDATAYLHGDVVKCVMLTSQVPVTSCVPITLYEVFITALSGAIDRIF